MATRNKRARRRSATEAAALVAKFESSGQTRSAFCRAHGLALNTLDYWRRRLRSKNAGHAVVPVTVVPSAPDASYEVELRNGRRLRIAAPIDKESLAALLSVLDPC